MILKSKESAGLVERIKEMLGVGKKHVNMSQFNLSNLFFCSEVEEKKIGKQIK